MTQYYAAIIRATRRSALAIKRMQRWSRVANETRKQGGFDWRAEAALTRARRDYERAQEILASHPLSGDDIAARQASYPKARD